MGALRQNLVCLITARFFYLFPYSPNILFMNYFIIVNPASNFVSFSTTNHNVCFGDTVPAVIKEYTNLQYANDYGERLISYTWGGKLITKSIRQYMKEDCFVSGL